MGRRPREEEEGGIYHVIQRGDNRAFVFGEDIDKEYFINTLVASTSILDAMIKLRYNYDNKSRRE